MKKKTIILLGRLTLLGKYFVVFDLPTLPTMEYGGLTESDWLELMDPSTSFNFISNRVIQLKCETPCLGV